MTRAGARAMRIGFQKTMRKVGERKMPGLVGLCWVITALAACLAGADLFFAMTKANGAPQQAARAAMAVATCVIPYVFTRACQAFVAMGRQRDMLAALNAMRDGRLARD